jgi:Rrf2 family cysteine metabolism transcriptional repressor
LRLSTRGRYATRAMLDLAMHYGQGPILVREISKRQGISERYLEQLLLPLKAAGLVRSMRGAHGGFTLARLPSEIRLIEIVQTMEGSTAPADCVDDAGICAHSRACVTREVWADMKRAADTVLEATTLQDLLARQKAAEEGASNARNS